MPLFGRRRHTTTRRTHHTTTTTGRRTGFFHRKDPNRRAAGLRAALANPNTTHDGRKRAEAELHSMGRSAHVPLSTKIKRTLGIRSSPRTHRQTNYRY
ncbi:hypothetical protein FS837_002853 [Tulasnella sp. UAMH 9824]|nr:hypothetical protein FS837_002853 [Tulasnella sp. UAMH 9824]